MLRLHGLLVIILVSISFLAHLPQAEATVLTVPDPYPTIQDAVDAAEPGFIIEVSPGVYPESVIVGQSLTIVGLDKSTTIVDGSIGSYAFWLDTDGITIRGFTMRYCYNYGVIASYSGGHTIEDNIFLNNGYGVYLTNSPSVNNITDNTFSNNNLAGICAGFSNDNLISNNYISDGVYGIKFNEECQYNNIINNVITGTSHGIYAKFSPNNIIDQNNITSIMTGIASVNSDNVDIRNNTVSEAAYGIEIYSSMYNTVFGNTAAQNGEGVYLVNANDNTIDSNLASNNGWGIYLYNSDNNMILQNTFSFNAYGIDLVSDSRFNTIAWNNILNNTVQMHQDSMSGINSWYKKTGGTDYGNYWSNYAGEDIDEPPDGVGDTMLPHMGVDNYPLMNPWNTVHDLAVISVVTSDDAVYQGQTVNITVVVRNEGTVTENFNVTARYFNRPIGTQQVTNLTRLKTKTILFNWNTTSVPTGFSYEISAEAQPVASETDKLDNNVIDGTVNVKILADIDGDYDVDADDFALFAGAYGSNLGDPSYDPQCDFDGDGDVDPDDYSIFCANYGKTC
jgi:parallel beta-helix repeat protein